MSSGKITTENNEKVRAYRLSRSKSKNNPLLKISGTLLEESTEENKDKYFSILQGQDQNENGVVKDMNNNMDNDNENVGNNGKTKSKGRQKFPSIIDVLKEEVLYWQDKAKYREFLQEFQVPALEEHVAVLQKENEMLKNERDEANRRVDLFLNTFSNDIKNIIREYSSRIENLEYDSKKEASFRTMWERNSKLEYEKMKLESDIKGLQSKLRVVEDSRDFYEGKYYDITGRCVELYNRLLELDPVLKEEKDKADNEIIKLIQEGMRLWRKNKDDKDEKNECAVVQNETDDTDGTDGVNKADEVDEIEDDGGEVNLIDVDERDLINAINTLEYNNVLVNMTKEDEDKEQT